MIFAIFLSLIFRELFILQIINNDENTQDILNQNYEGGDFKINGVPFEISVQERTDMRSDGNIEGPIVKIPGDGRF